MCTVLHIIYVHTHAHAAHTRALQHGELVDVSRGCLYMYMHNRSDTIIFVLWSVGNSMFTTLWVTFEWFIYYLSWFIIIVITEYIYTYIYTYGYVLYCYYFSIQYNNNVCTIRCSNWLAKKRGKCDQEVFRKLLFRSPTPNTVVNSQVFACYTMYIIS
jgi:hypothetical protein